MAGQELKLNDVSVSRENRRCGMYPKPKLPLLRRGYGLVSEYRADLNDVIDDNDIAFEKEAGQTGPGLTDRVLG